ncbi:MAG: hypothetical protein ACPL68_07495 [Candidatus Hydrothermia bacterium]
MKKLMLVLAGMAWLMWPGKAGALSLGCELPGYEVGQHYNPDAEWCKQKKCSPEWLYKIPWGLCETGYAWWIQKLQGCQIIGGACYGFYAGGDIDCESEGEDSWEPEPDPWEDR